MPNIIKNLLHYSARRAVHPLGMFETLKWDPECVWPVWASHQCSERKESHLFFMTFTPGGPAFTETWCRRNCKCRHLSECSRGLLRNSDQLYCQFPSNVESLDGTFLQRIMTNLNAPRTRQVKLCHLIIHVITNIYESFSYVKQKKWIFEECPSCSFPCNKSKRGQKCSM